MAKHSLNLIAKQMIEISSRKTWEAGQGKAILQYTLPVGVWWFYKIVQLSAVKIQNRLQLCCEIWLHSKLKCNNINPFAWLIHSLPRGVQTSHHIYLGVYRRIHVALKALEPQIVGACVLFYASCRLFYPFMSSMPIVVCCILSCLLCRRLFYPFMSSMPVVVCFILSCLLCQSSSVVSFHVFYANRRLLYPFVSSMPVVVCCVLSCLLLLFFAHVSHSLMFCQQRTVGSDVEERPFWRARLNVLICAGYGSHRGLIIYVADCSGLKYTKYIRS